MHNSIGVKSCLADRGMNTNLLCPLCRVEVETIIHALRDCKMVREVWFNLSIARNDVTYFTSEVTSWMIKNAKLDHSLHWNTIFLFAIWILWQRRNLVIFQNQSTRPNIHLKIIQRAQEFIHYGLKPSVETRQVLKPIRWERPNKGWVKLNTDGSSSGNLGPAGCGGILRDKNGDWLLGFSKKIRIASILWQNYRL